MEMELQQLQIPTMIILMEALINHLMRKIVEAVVAQDYLKEALLAFALVLVYVFMLQPLL